MWTMLSLGNRHRPCLGVSNRTGRKRTSDSDRPPPLRKQTIGCAFDSLLASKPRPLPATCPVTIGIPCTRSGPSAAAVPHKHTRCIIYSATSPPGIQAGSNHTGAARAFTPSPPMALRAADSSRAPFSGQTSSPCLPYVLLRPTHVSLPFSQLSEGKGLAGLQREGRTTASDPRGGTLARGQRRSRGSWT